MISFEKKISIKYFISSFNPWKSSLKKAPSKRPMYHIKILIHYGLFQ